MDTSTALAILGLSSDASMEEARVAYRARAKACHPDITCRNRMPEADADAAMKELNHAYKVLAQALPRTRVQPVTMPEQPAPEPSTGSGGAERNRVSGTGGLAAWFRKTLRSGRPRRPGPQQSPPGKRTPSPAKPAVRFTDVFQEAVAGKQAEKHPSGYRKAHRRPFDYTAYIRLKQTMAQQRRFKNRDSGPIERIQPVSRITPSGSD